MIDAANICQNTFYQKPDESPSYLYNLIPNLLPAYSTCNPKNLPSVLLKPDTFSLKTIYFIHYHRIEQTRFEYPLFSFLQAIQKTNLRNRKTTF